MSPPHYYATHVTRLVGQGSATFFEVELEPPGRVPGQVPGERVRVVIQGEANALPEAIMAKARHVVASVAAAEWIRQQGETTAKPDDPPGSEVRAASC
jgi:hypothetical protein